MQHILMLIGIVPFQIVVPIWLGLRAGRRPETRPRALVVLGALFPLMAIYVFLSAAALLQRNLFTGSALAAVWVFSLPAYAVAIVLGLAVSLCKKPEDLVGRFAMGVASTMGIIVLLAMWLG